MPRHAQTMTSADPGREVTRGDRAGALTAHSYEQGQRFLSGRSPQQRKRLGQFLTAPEVARFMAQRSGGLRDDCRILDPAVGSGVLLCAIIDHAISLGYPSRLYLQGYEVDAEMCRCARRVLDVAAARGAQAGIQVRYDVRQEDFIMRQAPLRQGSLFAEEGGPSWQAPERYDLIIANPPYFKLAGHDDRVRALAGQVQGHTNIYTLFMAAAIELLAEDGKACFIVPRSFCSGAYFAGFRREFIARAEPLHIHLFESRQDAFREDDVLQENMIVTFRRRQMGQGEKDRGEGAGGVMLSASQGVDGLATWPIYRHVPAEQFIAGRGGACFLRLPTTDLDGDVVTAVDAWPESLHSAGLAVSTGPVVPFRSEPELMDASAVQSGDAVPLLWMQHVRRQRIEWPLPQLSKPQAISARSELLLRARNYVILRRFSAKEDRRRLVAAPLLCAAFDHEHVGVENHLNYIYGKRGDLREDEAVGLSALLNSAIVDRYVRVLNGNTQVNALELRSLPLPPLAVIRQIGATVLATGPEIDPDPVVFSVLRQQGYLPPEFPYFEETRFGMGKIQEAQDILKTLGLPRPQQNEISALTLLALVGLSEEEPWTAAQRQSLRIHDILGQIKALFGREYAENTRETIRRQVIHQLMQAGIVERNPDVPDLPTNSPRTHYALSVPALAALRAYGTSAWPDEARRFLEEQRALIETYSQARQHHRVPLRLADGTEYHLSPGAHSELQAAIVEDFGPRFAPGARVLYVGDTANKSLHMDAEGFASLGLSFSQHDKLPDVMLYDERRNWVYLIEAVTSHGPISPKRRMELEQLLQECNAVAVYVTAFPDFFAFKEFLLEIAWETEVWIAATPSHLIHFNGDRLLQPTS